MHRLCSKTSVITLLLIIVASLFAVILIQNNFAASDIIVTNSNSLSASINPSGIIQLKLNQSQVFEANSSSKDIPITYKWTIESASIASASNQTNYLLITHENQAVFKLLTENLNFCSLRVTLNLKESSVNATVTIEQITLPSIKQANQQPINQPTSQPTTVPTPTQTQTPSENQDFNQNAPITNTNNQILNADLIVQNNAKFHYQVINSTDNSIITEYSSNSANLTLNQAIANGGVIAISSGNYTGSRLIVPSNTNIISSPDAIGIRYASIGDGARINERNFNAAFGGYQTGAYTVTTNVIDSATNTKCYLAFKPDNSIYYFSTNASYVLNNAASSGGGIFIAGNLTLNNPIILSVSRTSLYSDGTGVLTFNNINGIIITGTEVTISNLCLRQIDFARTRIAILCNGTNTKQVGYETFSNLKLWGWQTALFMKYTISTQANGIDTTFSLTGLHIWGQSTNNVFTNCQFSNYETSIPTVLIDRDDVLDISPEGNMISNSLIYGGNPAVYLRYAVASQISNSVVDGWNQQGVKIIGRQDNSLSDNWIGASPGSASSIAMEVSSGSTSIKGNTLSALNWTFYVHNSKNCLISGNNFISPANIDIYSVNNNGGSIANNNLLANSVMGIVTQNSYGFSVYSNTLTGKTTAINMITSDHNTVVSNIINETQQNGIILDGSSFNSIMANSISNSGQKSNNSYVDIWLVNNSTYNNVCDNIITAFGINRSAWGILESSPADDYNIYSGNAISGQISGAIGINGPDSVRGSNSPKIG
jgi:parallel beta-helix repeat protein